MERAGRHRDIPANAGGSQPGSVYPLAFVDRIAHEKTEQCWKAVHLENEYLRVTTLPRLGGRIHVALDKTNGDGLILPPDRHQASRVGLAGPWISVGIECNWTQHHRPSRFTPVDVCARCSCHDIEGTC